MKKEFKMSIDSQNYSNFINTIKTEQPDTLNKISVLYS